MNGVVVVVRQIICECADIAPRFLNLGAAPESVYHTFFFSKLTNRARCVNINRDHSSPEIHSDGFMPNLPKQHCFFPNSIQTFFQQNQKFSGTTPNHLVSARLMVQPLAENTPPQFCWYRTGDHSLLSIWFCVDPEVTPWRDEDRRVESFRWPYLTSTTGILWRNRPNGAPPPVVEPMFVRLLVRSSKGQLASISVVVSCHQSCLLERGRPWS